MRDSEVLAIKNSAEFAEYATSLRRLLWEFLKWDEAQVNAHLEGALQNPGFRMYYAHDGPCDKAARLVIRERVRQQVKGVAGVRLHQRVERAITQTGDRKAVCFPDQDASLPSTLIAGDETIGSVLLCDDDAELTLNDEVGAWYVKLKSGMTFSMSKSSEVMLIGADTRPRYFHYLAPVKLIPEP